MDDDIVSKYDESKYKLQKLLSTQKTNQTIVQGQQINKIVKDDDEISELSESGSEENSVKPNANITDEFKESVVAYVNYDNLIKAKKEEIKELKKMMEKPQKCILEYLDSVQRRKIKIKTDQLSKNVSLTKTSLKIDLIKNSIMEVIENVNTNDPNIITEKIIETLQSKRSLKTNVSLRRTSSKN